MDMKELNVGISIDVTPVIDDMDYIDDVLLKYGIDIANYDGSERKMSYKFDSMMALRYFIRSIDKFSIDYELLFNKSENNFIKLRYNGNLDEESSTYHSTMVYFSHCGLKKLSRYEAIEFIKDLLGVHRFDVDLEFKTMIGVHKFDLASLDNLIISCNNVFINLDRDNLKLFCFYNCSFNKNNYISHIYVGNHKFDIVFDDVDRGKNYTDAKNFHDNLVMFKRGLGVETYTLKKG